MHSAALLMIKKVNNKYILETSKHRSLVKRLRYASNPTHQDAGFSLVELIAVIMMVGILAAIAVPSWLAFINRQRVNKANDAVLTALQEAQREAKKKKLSYSVSFKVENQIPKIVIHPDSETASSVANNRWQPLGGDLGIQSQQIILLTNLTSKNTVGTSVNSNPNYLNTPQTITFDYMGTLANANLGTPPTGSTETPGLKVVVAASNVKRCVIVKTLLGTMLTEKDGNCN
ncbi:pilus assembly FimT family protein [Fischerella muscicola]|uniref:Prepilin-type N-terminal cleavage/methylation domain-containing protein n=1 Tax=Fischerella muscicola CCMEE 5323 TaxID=2019572 RepID=A0A2N6K5T6_FISMU|nr:type II secretion system protein [Fischerella sp. FACHB-380]PLZ91971.1 prepilin-type N-terminal cleavage/methylation domain-containing protein [Fischerella muscicola CCMEE 5323]